MQLSDQATVTLERQEASANRDRMKKDARDKGDPSQPGLPLLIEPLYLTVHLFLSINVDEESIDLSTCFQEKFGLS